MNTEATWWQAFFPGAYSDYQGSKGLKERARLESDWIFANLCLKPGDNVLDVPTGQGRIALELADRGVAVTGIDFNDKALAAAESIALQNGLAIEWECADMRTFVRPDGFDHAICFFQSVGYFSAADELEFFKNIARSLRPGGKFLIDTHVMESWLPAFEERYWMWDEVAGRRIRVVEECFFDCETSRVEMAVTFIEDDGRTQTGELSVRLYSYRELCELLREAGFCRFYGLETGTSNPFRVGAAHLGLFAEVPGK